MEIGNMLPGIQTLVEMLSKHLIVPFITTNRLAFSADPLGELSENDLEKVIYDGATFFDSSVPWRFCTTGLSTLWDELPRGRLIFISVHTQCLNRE
jgi:hypothetical protein